MDIKKKSISIVVPTYNEEDNVEAMAKAIKVVFAAKLGGYDYDIIFIDNCSKDNTRPLLEKLCASDKRIKAIFNVKNFGQFNSPYYGLLNTTGDCGILIACDFQDPVELIPKFVKEWETGKYQIVCGIKTSSRENKLVYHLRSIYYRTIKRMSDVEQIEHFTGFGLYDRSFIETLKKLDDPKPFLRGIVAELGGKRKEIEYEQPKRRAGKTSNNWYSLYDGAMLSFTTYTKIGLRLATMIGFLIAVISFLLGVVYLALKCVYWDRFPAGTAPVLIGTFFLGALQLFFIGFMGEYILSINNRVMHRPLVVEEKRINFDKADCEERDLDEK